VDDDPSSDDMLEVKTNNSLRRNSSDPNLTLISVYSPDKIVNVQVNVQRSSSSAASKTSQLFSLFKMPKRRSVSESSTKPELLKPVVGTVSNTNSNKAETIVEASKKRKQDKNNRFISFIRYLFCQFVPVGSNAIVTPTNNNQTTYNNNDLSNTNYVPASTQVDQHTKV
jgi:hypothetical protein